MQWPYRYFCRKSKTPSIKDRCNGKSESIDFEYSDHRLRSVGWLKNNLGTQLNFWFFSHFRSKSFTCSYQTLQTALLLIWWISLNFVMVLCFSFQIWDERNTKIRFNCAANTRKRWKKLKIQIKKIEFSFVCAISFGLFDV